MILAFCAVGWTLALVLGGLAWMWQRMVGRLVGEEVRQRAAHLQYRDQVIGWLHDVRMNERQYGDARIAELRAAHDADLTRVHAEHEKALGTQMAAFAATIEGLMNTATFGSKAGPQPAVRVAREPDAEDRVVASIRADTVEAGARALAAQYKAAGIDVTEEECREEARSMLLGITPGEDAPLPTAAAERVAVLARD